MIEYTTMIQTFELPPEVIEMKGIEFSKKLGDSIELVARKVTKAAESVDGGGWEILSHDIIRFGQFLSVSFLLKRIK